MKLTIVGTGYVGLVTGACFSEMGNIVCCVDIDDSKVEDLKKGIIPIYEPGLNEIVTKNSENGNLFFSTKLSDGLNNCDICFIAVGTPMGEDGSADLQYVLTAAKEIGEIVNNDLIVVNKSTVPVGTADKVKEIIDRELIKRNVDYDICVVSNPEFLKEGTAVADFMRPDRVIIGTDNLKVFEKVKELYSPFTDKDERFISMDVRSSEMTKYASNAMLATRISFINEIANICECVGADVNRVREGIGSDSRIGFSFLYPGCGYGGSCFPKDIKALIQIAAENDYDTSILKGVESVNNHQKTVLIKKIVNRFGEDLTGLTFAVWGLSFKPETIDMREAASVVIIQKLIELGAKINSYDPKTVEIAKEFYFKDNKNIKFFKNKYDAIEDADAMVLVTEWKEFRSPDFDEIEKRIGNKIIFDGRNQYNGKNLSNRGFEYYQIGILDSFK